jgi:hypothetical protein
MKILTKLTQALHTPTWLFSLLAFVFVLRIPSFFEPYSYGDEMIYLTLGEAVRQGIPLYSGIHDNKPPLLYLMAALAGNLFWFKALLTLWLLATIYIFWKLLDFLFPKNIKAQIAGTSIFALLTTIPLLEGNIVNAELFMIGPTILAFLILLSNKLTPNNLFFSGILFSISTLFKVPAAFDIPAIIFLWLAASKLKFKNLKSIAKNTLILFIGFATPILLTLAWYFLQGALKEYIVAAFLQNVGYLSSWRPDESREPFFVKNLPLIQRALVVLLGLLLLYWKKSRLSKTFIFSTSWLLLTLFAITLSERPYPHYLIQGIAPFSILMTLFFTRKNFEQVLVVLPLTLSFFVPFYYKFWHYPTLPYYQKFTKLISGQYSKDEYFATFGSHVPKNYKVSEYLLASLKDNEKIFVWGTDSSTIYALTKHFPPGKYVADYHIKDFSGPKELINTLSSNMPVFIVLLPSHEEIVGLQAFLNTNYAFVENIEGAEIWKLLTPQVRSLLSS